MKKILLTSLAVLLFANPNLELDKFAKIEDFSPTSEKKGSLWVPQFSSEYLSKFNLSENFNLEKNKENNIGFNLKFNVDPSLLSYEKNILLEKENNFNNMNIQPDPLSQEFNNGTQ